MPEVFAPAGAFVGAAAGLWEAAQFRQALGRMDAVERAHNAHVNALGLHGTR